MQNWPPAVIGAIGWSLAPLLIFGFAGEKVTKRIDRLPKSVRLALPAIFGIPYALVANWAGIFHWKWFVLYLAVPVTVALVLSWAKKTDPLERRIRLDFIVLLGLGLAVDLRWLEPAWPAHLTVISKMILLDTAIYGFTAIRQLSDVGFDLRPQYHDLIVGTRELLFYAPLAVPLGLALGFLHTHVYLPSATTAVSAWIFTFIFIAIPEEIYFRGWMQNLLERRLGRNGSLWLTAVIFGFSHFNKRAAHFNWRYVLLATLAGIFYGRAWRERRRVFASSITHACVDTIWSIWLR